MGKSAFGPGIKAGGPNYVVPLMTFRDAAPPPGTETLKNPRLEMLRDLLRESRNAFPADDLDRVLAAIGSYALNFQEEFSLKHDHVRLVGQDNFRRYLPVRSIALRLHPEDTPFDILARLAAAFTIGGRVLLSLPPGLRSEPLDRIRGWQPRFRDHLTIQDQGDGDLVAAMRDGCVERVRAAAPGRVGTEVFRAVPETGVYIADAPVLMEGRVELLWYVREQSVCIDYHRYGNLGRRSGEERRQPS
jgi:RHH-type proline utilization regulon transcriptional repressor/proline dehydrogenase/delta 1-pyrroline-5-carboxylate dehydrogenase